MGEDGDRGEGKGLDGEASVQCHSGWVEWEYGGGLWGDYAKQVSDVAAESECQDHATVQGTELCRLCKRACGLRVSLSACSLLLER